MKIIALSVLALVTVSAACAQSLQEQANKLDRVVASAMMKKDFKALEKALKDGVTADFVYEENGQKQNFKQMFEGMKMGLGAMQKITKSEAKSKILKEEATKATGTTTHTMAGTTMGQDKKEHTMTFVGTSMDTYVKVGGKWKLSRMVMKTTAATLDGKPMSGM